MDNAMGGGRLHPGIRVFKALISSGLGTVQRLTEELQRAEKEARQFINHLLPSRYLLCMTSKETDRREGALLSVNTVKFGLLYKLPTILTQIWC